MLLKVGIILVIIICLFDFLLVIGVGKLKTEDEKIDELNEEAKYLAEYKEKNYKKINHIK